MGDQSRQLSNVVWYHSTFAKQRQTPVNQPTSHIVRAGSELKKYLYVLHVVTKQLDLCNSTSIRWEDTACHQKVKHEYSFSNAEEDVNSDKKCGHTCDYHLMSHFEMLRFVLPKSR